MGKVFQHPAGRVIRWELSTEVDTEELERLRAEVKANPGSTAFEALVSALSKAGEVRDAEEVCRLGLAHHPDLVTAKVALARLLMARGALDEATLLLSEAAGSSPEYADTFRALGQLLLEAGDNDRARSILEYAEELAPADSRIAELLLEAGGSPASSDAPTVVANGDHLESSSAAPAAPSVAADDDEEELDSSVLEEVNTPTPAPLPLARPPAAPAAAMPVFVAPPPPLAAPTAAQAALPTNAYAPPPHMPQMADPTAGASDPFANEAPPTAPNPTAPNPRPDLVTPFPVNLSDDTPTFGADAPMPAQPMPGAAQPMGMMREGSFLGQTLEPEVLEERPISTVGALHELARPLPPPPPWSGGSGYEATPKLQPAVGGGHGGMGSRASGLWRSSSPGTRQAVVATAVGVLIVLGAVGLWPDGDEAPTGSETAAESAGEPASGAETASAPSAPRSTDRPVTVIDAELPALGKLLAETSGLAPTDAEAADKLAERALAAAIHTLDYGFPSGPAAEKAASAAESEKTSTAARTVRIEGARALLALADRRLDDAAQAAERALAAGPQHPEAAWVAGRVAAASGDIATAAQRLADALKGAPGFRAAGFESTMVFLDQGDHRQARATLAAALGDKPPSLRERLLLAEMARAESVGTGAPLVGVACEQDGSQSPLLSVRCRLHGALVARLEGKRGVALQEVTAIATELAGDPRTAARAALLLAALGNIDGADKLGQAASLAKSTALPAQWWAWAVALGRGTARPQNVPATASGPEERILLTRLALEKGGPEALGKTLMELGQPALTMDKDLEMFAALGQAAPPAFRSELERRAKNGNSLANYVLGRLALGRGDSATAARHLAGALGGHGDTCSVAKLLLGIDSKMRPAPVAGSEDIVGALAGHNAACSGLGS